MTRREGLKTLRMTARRGSYKLRETKRKFQKSEVENEIQRIYEVAAVCR